MNSTTAGHAVMETHTLVIENFNKYDSVWIVLLYVVLFPSFLAQLFFMRGVQLIGPGRAGVFVNLVPIFASIFSVVLLDEDFQTYHALALVFVLGGIGIAEWARRT
mgnify:CR=1 FL=1